MGPVDILGAYPPFEERQARTAPYRVRGGRSDQRPDGGDENAHHGAIQSPRENRHENTRDRRDKNLGDLEPEQDQGAPMPGASEEPFQARAGEEGCRFDADPNQRGHDGREKDPVDPCEPGVGLRAGHGRRM